MPGVTAPDGPDLTDPRESERENRLVQQFATAIALAEQVHAPMYDVLEVHRQMVGGLLFQHFRGVVQAGPYAGMRLPGMEPDSGPKVLGCYEQELHPAIERMAARRPGRIVNLGAGNGYHTVGLARMVPEATVIGADPEESTVAGFTAAVQLNGLTARVFRTGLVAGEKLRGLVTGVDRVLLFLDIEGGELETLEPGLVPALAHADLIVECHDLFVEGTTAGLIERFAPTHRITRIDEGGRDPNTLSALRRLKNADRWAAVSENRPCAMHWLALEASCRN